MKYSVVIVDDHQLIAKAIGSIVQEFADFEVMYDAQNGQILTEKFKVRGNVPDIVLLDISMPVMNGFETAKWLSENYPAVKIMALSMQDDDESLLKMIKNGARGYLHKNVSPAELELALKTLIAKGMYYPDWAMSKVFLSVAQPETKKESFSTKLSDREIEFLSYVCTELNYKEIADLMCCSPRTIEGYRDALFEKLGVKTRVGLAMYAVKTQIAEA